MEICLNNQLLKDNISLLFLFLFLGFSSNLYAQRWDENCLELLTSKSAIIKSKKYTALFENKMVDELINCNDSSITKKNLINLLGEPDQTRTLYSGIHKCNFTSLIYFLKPTYASKWFIGQVLDFEFKEESEICYNINAIRYCE